MDSLNKADIQWEVFSGKGEEGAFVEPFRKKQLHIRGMTDPGVPIPAGEMTKT